MMAAAAAANRWRRARNVLAVRLDNLGDVLMTSPALAAIRESLPGSRLTLLASASGVALSTHLPMLDEAIEFRAPWVKHAGLAPDALGHADGRMIDALVERRFDAAVIFTTCTQSALPAALLCRLAGIPLRLAHSRENPYELLTDWVADTDVIESGMRHEVARQLALVQSVGLHTADDRLRFEVGPHGRHSIGGELRRAGLDPSRPYFVVHPGATAASRRYPAELFGASADLIAQRSGRAPVFSGDASEHGLIEQARRAMSGPSWSVGGQLDLAQLGALIEGAEVLVANNSGPVHVAAALGTPVVDLYALTNPQHTPWRVRSHVLNQDVPCRHCLKSICPEGHHDCLRRVDAVTVAHAALDLMGVDERATASVPIKVFGSINSGGGRAPDRPSARAESGAAQAGASEASSLVSARSQAGSDGFIAGRPAVDDGRRPAGATA